MNWTNRQVLMKLLVYRSSFLLYHIPSVDHDYTPNIAHRIRHVHLPIVPEVMKIKLCSNLQNIIFFWYLYNAMFLGKIKNAYPGSKPVIFVLFVSRYKMIWVPSVPPKFVFLMSWNIYILKIPTRRFCRRSIPSFCELLLCKWLLFLKITLRKGVDGKSGKTSLQI